MQCAPVPPVRMSFVCSRSTDRPTDRHSLFPSVLFWDSHFVLSLARAPSLTPSVLLVRMPRRKATSDLSATANGTPSAPKKARTVETPVVIRQHKEDDGQVSVFLHLPRFLHSFPQAEAFRAFARGLEFPAQRSRFMASKTPRDELWIARNRTPYTFSGKTRLPCPVVWDDASFLAQLANHINGAVNALLPASFSPCDVSAALVNRYRHGLDSISEHSDDEPCLGTNPTIASLSLGATRVFKVAHQPPSAAAAAGSPRRRTRQSYSFHLNDADLLVMAGAAQQFWRHRINKDPVLVKARKADPAFVPPPAERINFTLRPHHAS